MRVFIILHLSLLACNRQETKQKENEHLNRYWVSKHLEPYTIDSAVGGGQTMYGSGFLLRLDSNGQAVSLGADYIWMNDSLYQRGEPGMSIKYGSWEVSEQRLFLNQKLLYKMIMHTSDKIGQTELDTLMLRGDSLLIHKTDTLTPVKKPSNELELLLNGIINYHSKKNGS